MSTTAKSMLQIKKKLELITQGKGWRNETIRGKLTALVEKQEKPNI